MGGQIILLVLGFVLTSVLGGLLGYYFQRRTWEANRREAERQAGAAVFDEISRAMDRRLYRMWLLYWALRAGDQDRLAKLMDEYRTVLRDWNDNLNRNLALAHRYFGQRVWKYLDDAFYPEFQHLGRLLEGHYRQRHDPKAEATVQLHRAGRRLKALSDDIYYLKRYIISLIQHGRVGLYQTKEGEDELAPWRSELRHGSRGLRVAQWQRDLNREGDGHLVIDGWFGQATREATVRFQGANGLPADGIVGELTRRKMDQSLTGMEGRQIGW